MELFTKVQISASEFQVDYQSKLMFLGSCFADNISKRFIERKFHALANPLGVLYNPLSIENFVRKIAGQENEPWCRWDYQGTFEDKDLNRITSEAREFLKSANVVFITLGTAFVYFLKEKVKAVANCHKEPAELFERRLISVDEASEAIRNIASAVHAVNPGAQVIFTVSPLRHLNDGAHGNNLSKATLLLAIEKAGVPYFPSYEIVMDELRDYRFYAEDMTHLSAVAEDYIFERMSNVYCTETTIANMKRVEKFMKTVNHRITGSDQARISQFAEEQIAQAVALEKQIPGLDLGEEKKYFSSLL